MQEEVKRHTFGHKHKYERVMLLAHGQSAEVFLVERLPDRKRLVAKVVRNTDYHQMVIQEAKRLRKLESDYIVKCFNCFEDRLNGDEVMVTILEYFDCKIALLSF